MKKIISAVMSTATCSAFAFGNFASVEMDSLQASATSSIESYQEILDMYYNRIQAGWDDAMWTCDPEGIGMADTLPYNYSYLWYLYAKDKDLSEIGYQFIDINNDGSEELIVSPILDESGNPNQVIYDLYDYSDNPHALSSVENSAENYRYYLDSNNKICMVGSDEDGSYYQYFYWNRSSLGGMEDWEEYKYDASENEWVYVTTTDGFSYDGTSITEEEAQQAIASHVYQDLNLTPFSEYTPSSSSSTEEPDDDNGDVEYMLENGITLDFNNDGQVDAKDASMILIYAAQHGAGLVQNLEEFIANQNNT